MDRSGLSSSTSGTLSGAGLPSLSPSASPGSLVALRPPGAVTVIGYIRLTTFSSDASEEVARAIGRLRAAGAERFVLDLRK